MEKPGFSAQPLRPPQLSCTHTGLGLEKSLAPSLHWFLQAPQCTGDSKAKANTSQRTAPGRENSFPKPPSVARGKGQHGKRQCEKEQLRGTDAITNKNKNKKGEEGEKNTE